MGERGRRLGGVLLLVVFAALGACNQDNDGGGNGTLDEVRAALRQRAQLLIAGDTEGYLAGAEGDALDLETQIAEGAAAVPLSFVNVSFTPRRTLAPDVTEFREVPVRVVFRYEGLPDDNPFEFALRYDVERRGQRWLVTQSELEPDEPSPLWVREEVEITRSPHFLAIHLPTVEGADAALDLAEQARERLAERLRSVQPDAVHLVLLARDHDELELVTEESFPDEVVAAANSFLAPFVLPSQRQIVVNMESLYQEGGARVEGESDEVKPVEVFQHELAHLALSRFDDPFMPAWVSEGAAMYLSGERRTESWRFASERDLFDDLSVLDLQDQDSLDGLTYAYANAAFLMLEEAFGAEALWEFYVTFRPLAPSQAYVDNPSGPALQRVFGINETEVDVRTKAYIEEQVAAAQ